MVTYLVWTHLLKNAELGPVFALSILVGVFATGMCAAAFSESEVDARTYLLLIPVAGLSFGCSIFVPVIVDICVVVVALCIPVVVIKAIGFALNMAETSLDRKFEKYRGGMRRCLGSGLTMPARYTI